MAAFMRMEWSHDRVAAKTQSLIFLTKLFAASLVGGSLATISVSDVALKTSLTCDGDWRLGQNDT